MVVAVAPLAPEVVAAVAVEVEAVAAVAAVEGSVATGPPLTPRIQTTSQRYLWPFVVSVNVCVCLTAWGAASLVQPGSPIVLGAFDPLAPRITKVLPAVSVTSFSDASDCAEWRSTSRPALPPDGGMVGTCADHEVVGSPSMASVGSPKLLIG